MSSPKTHVLDMGGIGLSTLTEVSRTKTHIVLRHYNGHTITLTLDDFAWFGGK